MLADRIQSSPSFGIKISPDLIKAADKYYTKNNRSQELFNRFYRKAKFMQENYGFDEYTLITRKAKRNGQTMNALYAEKDGPQRQRILLSIKDNFAKILEKFKRISEYELNNKLML